MPDNASLSLVESLRQEEALATIAARRALSSFLKQFSWQVFATLTFQKSFSPSAARRAFVRWFYGLILPAYLLDPAAFDGLPPKQRQVLLQRRRKILRRHHPVAFVALEWGKTDRGVPHLHALLSGVGGDDLACQRAEGLWQSYGRARVEPYDPRRGAAFYCSKYLFKDSDDVGEWWLEGSSSAWRWWTARSSSPRNEAGTVRGRP